MKTITMYELLGMVKDGKAPKKIKIDNDILTLSETNIIQYNFEQTGQLNWEYYIENNILNEKIVEILEEKEIPEKLEYEESDENGEFSINGFTFDFEQKIQIIKTVNEIIDFLKQN